MKSSPFSIAIIVPLLAIIPFAHSNSVWNSQDYDLHSGDFDGDGKTDILYIAKDINKMSGISSSYSDAPSIPLQSWHSSFLGIQWHGQQYKVIIGDFNSDRRSDILLQHVAAGDSFLLLAGVDGRFQSVAQRIGDDYRGLGWSFAQHGILSGDFGGPEEGLFFQAAKPDGVNAVAYASFSGLFLDYPTQTFTDITWPILRWSREHSVINVGDFNGDGFSDLLVQPTHSWVFVGLDILVPIPVYANNAFAVVYSQGGDVPFQPSGVKQWSRFDYGVDWAPMSATPIVGDFNNDGRDDVLLQSQQAGRPSYLLTGAASGAAFASPSVITSNVPIAADGARLVAIRNGNSTGLYIQSTSPTGTNYIATSVGANIQAIAQDSSVAAVEVISYGYDARGRLKTVKRAGSINQSLETNYTYDKANNRTSLTISGSSR